VSVMLAAVAKRINSFELVFAVRVTSFHRATLYYMGVICL